MKRSRYQVQLTYLSADEDTEKSKMVYFISFNRHLPTSGVLKEIIEKFEENIGEDVVVTNIREFIKIC